MENMSDNTYNTTENSIDMSHLTVEQIKELTQVITQVESDIQQVKQLLMNSHHVPEVVDSGSAMPIQTPILQTVTTPIITPENTGTHQSLADLLRGQVAPASPKPTETSLPITNIQEVSTPEQKIDTMVVASLDPVSQVTISEKVPTSSSEQIVPVSEILPISLDKLQVIEQKQITSDHPTAHRFIGEAFYLPVSLDELSSVVQSTPEVTVNPNNVLFSETVVDVPTPTIPMSTDMPVSTVSNLKTDPVSYFNNPQQS